MRIYNARVYTDGRFIPGGLDFDRRIRDMGPHVADGDLDARGALVIPGAVDIHTHGALGADASDGTPEALERMSSYLGRQGVTAFLPTTMTLPEETLIAAMGAAAAFSRPRGGSKLAGIHAEGPFLSHARRGAQNEAHLHTPDAALFHRLNDAADGMIRLITVAPELEGASDFIRAISKECTVSLGHTAASYETAMAAFEAGASHVTHLFNGMEPLHHRAPGLLAAAAEADATAELISDGLHVHPAAVRLAHRIFGERLVLISDALRTAGMADGTYELGGQAVTLRAGRATIAGTDTLAGSSVSLTECLRRAVSFGIPPEQAVYAATAAPARAIRMADTLGALQIGRAADLVLLNEELQVQRVFIDGEEVV